MVFFERSKTLLVLLNRALACMWNPKTFISTD